MLKFWGNITDFWTKDLKCFEFKNYISLKQPSHTEFHTNFLERHNDIKQAFDNELPDCCKNFFNILNVDKGTISWTCLEPNNTIPVHHDAFYKLRTQHGVEVNQCVRYLIFLQDWELGHLVEFQEQPISRWRKGDVWSFDHQSYHCASNASNNEFVTCQVNTIITE